MAVGHDTVGVVAGWFGLGRSELNLRIGLIIGCPRSGTSILGELIASHPDVSYIFEASNIWELAGAGIDGSHRLTAEHATPRVKQKIRKWFEARQNGAAMVIEKCPRNALRVPFLRAVFPEAKLIHIVRDGRDVACSLTAGMGGDRWLHARPIRWKQIMAEHSGPVRCAVGWRDIVETTLSDLVDVPHHAISYEDLVHEPVRVAEGLLKYLELTPSEAVTDFTKRIQDRTAASYHARGQVEWYRADHPCRLGRWRYNLSQEQQRAIHELIGDTLTRLGFNGTPQALK